MSQVKTWELIGVPTLEGIGGKRRPKVTKLATLVTIAADNRRKRIEVRVGKSTAFISAANALGLAEHIAAAVGTLGPGAEYLMVAEGVKP